MESTKMDKMQDLIMKPVHVATSKPARVTYLNTILFMVTSSILLGLAVVAYTAFYFSYVPQIGIEKVIHLQYGDGPHPYGVASLDSFLVHEQAYDMSISLNVPRSPINLDAGNFMLSLTLLSPSYIPPPPTSTSPSALLPSHTSTITPTDILFTTRRTSILTYTSTLVSYSERLLALPFYTLGLKRESELLHVPMAESISFKKGYKNIPAYVLLELQTGQEMQVYDVHVHLVARLGGLRWIMYNHRITSFIIFVAAFWFMEVMWTGLGWVAMRTFFSSPADSGVKKIKGEAEDTDGSLAAVKKEETDELELSDTPRTFPTYGRQPPLKYEPPKVKEEDVEDYFLEESVIQPLEADDESEDFGGKSGRDSARDSGIGTSFSEAGEKGVSRRRSRGRLN